MKCAAVLLLVCVGFVVSQPQPQAVKEQPKDQKATQQKEAPQTAQAPKPVSEPSKEQKDQKKDEKKDVKKEQPQAKDSAANFQAECLAQSKAKQDLVAKAKMGEFKEDAALKNHMYCMAQKIGFMDNKGEILKEKLKEKSKALIGDQAAASKLVDACAQKRKDGPDTAFHTIKCFYEKSTPKHVVIV
ncbi:unnamed protein product [Acanthoscelides obtectus]|uniref:Uncharacterized protein n=1 Tax=Acanthoscelides obtectus TaxID=200917 RepID=A0A9P0PCQ0_ACAOB|nr:unnamed protein product [Acanthoscelides obtectus]CAK1666643.1 hypothetical protein AOBTE_LOCUS25418 [Acanthoscelides obtectus]